MRRAAGRPGPSSQQQAGGTAPLPRDPTASPGFCSPGSDITVKRIDFDEALFLHPQATFVNRTAEYAMVEADVSDGDVMMVDSAVSTAYAQPV